MPNFSSLAGPEVPEKFGVGGFQVTNMSNLNTRCFELSYVGF